MEIRVDEGLRAYIDPLTEDEYAALERSLLAEGCRDALVLWGDLLVDGHNRYGICQKHGIEFQTVQNTKFRSMDDVHLWMIDNHLGRRSVSDFQRGVLALRKKEILESRIGKGAGRDGIADGSEGAAGGAGGVGAESGAGVAGDSGSGGSGGVSGAQDAPWDDADSGSGNGSGSGVGAGSGAVAGSGAGVGGESAKAEAPLSRQALAKAARVSNATLGQIEKIQKTAAPELVGAVKSGVISINAAAEVASLPSDLQKAAVAAGRKELRELARQVREARAPAKAKPVVEDLPEDATPEQVEIHRLTLRVAELTEERDQLKKKVQNLTIALTEARAGHGDE
jgi:hypothetical protein